MMPRAKTVSRRMLPPANRSKKPKIEPALELMYSSQRCKLIPGVGIWLPSRYTARSPSANRSRLRRSGTRKMFANASKNLFILTPGPRELLRGGADYLRRPARFLDLLHGRFRKLVRFHRDLARQLARAQHLQAVMQFLDDAGCQERVHGKGLAFQFLQLVQVNDRILLLEDIGEAALGQAAVQRHLSAFEAALLAETRAGMLPFVAARRSLTVAGPHTAADPLLGMGLPLGGFDIAEIHVLFHHRQQMRHLLHHAAKYRSVRTFHYLVDLPESEPFYYTLVLLRGADRAVDQFNLDLVCHGTRPHYIYSMGDTAHPTFSRWRCHASPPPRPFRAATPEPRWSPSPHYADSAGRSISSARSAHRRP